MPSKKKLSPWIDVTAPLHAGMPHWPDQPDVKLERMVSMDDGAVCNVSMLHMSVHTGTHMDAPLHFVADGIGMDQMPLEATIGPCRVVEIKDRESIKVKHLKPLKLREGERRQRQVEEHFVNERPFDPEGICGLTRPGRHQQ